MPPRDFLRRRENGSSSWFFLVFAYLAVMPYTGFVLVTPIFLFTAMTFFGLRKRLVGVLSSIESR